MIAAVIALSALALLLGGGLIAVVVALRSSLASERASMAVEGIASRQQLAAERERDLAVAARAQAEAERDAAQASLVSFQSLFQKASAEEVRRVHDQIQAGTATDAVDVLNGILSTNLRNANRPADSGDTAGHDHGDAEPPAVRSP